MYVGYPLSSTTKVVGVIALVLIFVLGGSTIYLLLNCNGNDGNDDSCAFEKRKIEELERKLAAVITGGGGGCGSDFFTKKTGFFGVEIWVLLVAASVVGFVLFQAYFGPAATRGIRTAAGYVGKTVNSLTPSAIKNTVNGLIPRFSRGERLASHLESSPEAGREVRRSISGSAG